MDIMVQIASVVAAALQLQHHNVWLVITFISQPLRRRLRPDLL